MSDVYLTLAKGGLTSDHILIIPVGHFSSSVALKATLSSEKESLESTAIEMNQALEKLVQFYANSNQCVVSFEVFGGSGKGVMHHMHTQVVPIPIDLKSNIYDAFRNEALQEGMVVSSSLPSSESVPFVKVQVNNESPIIFIPDESFGGNYRFNHQIGRLVIAQLLGEPQRKDWKRCVLPEQEEEHLAAVLRESLESIIAPE